MPQPAPVVTVCIPAFDEVEAIGTTVASVLASAYPSDRFDVVVAVDGANPDVVRAAEAAGARVVEVVPNQGSYAARNAAADAARDDTAVLLFTDTDCVVAPEWMQSHVDALAHDDLSGGAVRFTFVGANPTPAEWVDSQRHLKQDVYVQRDHYAATCNLGVRRDVFSQLRFDPSFRTGGDANFGLRAHAAGFSLCYAAAARIDHPARPTRRALLAKVSRIAGGVLKQRERWVGRSFPPARLRAGRYRDAKKAGYSVSFWWGVKACLLDYRCQRMVVRAVVRALASNPESAE